MGVPGLWDVLRPAGELRSLTHLAVVDGFEANRSGVRGSRIGIDASIWFYHATYGKEGENPELRTLFFRCARLMAKPLLPLFVFDGPKRPEVKRKKKVSGKQHWMTTGMQQIIEAFGFEWRMAPGEAEAELAYLNRIGVIDAILSDDVDNFLFGAQTIIRNPGKMLSGNHAHPMKNAAGKDDEEHTYVYTAERIRTNEDVDLTVGGLILIGLLRGGDYNPEGLPGCGPNVAHALARCGFGDTLLEATRNLSREDLPAFLVNWRHEVRQELTTNSHKFMKSKKAKLAKDLPESFPDIDILLLYTNPVTSESERKVAPINYCWDREPDLGKIASVCEWFFEWGVKEIIVKRFRTVIWAPMVLRILRRAVLDEDERKKNGASLLPSTPRKNGKNAMMVTSPGTPSKMIARHFSSLKLNDEDEEDDEHRLIQKVHSKRTHASTDGVLEYRLEIAPAQLVKLTEAGVEGRRTLADGADISDGEGGDDDGDEDGEGKKKKGGPKKPPPEPTSHLRIWMPACMVSIVEPELVQAFEDVEENKARKKADAAERKALKAQGIALPKKSKATTTKATTTTKASSKSKSKAKAAAAPSSDEESSESEEDFGDVFGLPVGKGAGKKGGPKMGSRLRKGFSELEDEESELEGDDAEQAFLKASNSKPKATAPARVPAKKVDAFFPTRKPMLNAPPVDSMAKKGDSSKNPLQERRSILLELSNSDRLSSLGATSSSTTNAVSSTTSSSSLKRTITPFPLSFSDKDNDDFMSSAAPSGPSKPTTSDPSSSISTSPSKRNRQQSGTSTSPFSSDVERTISSPHKSPRKKKAQTSPNCKAASSTSTASVIPMVYDSKAQERDQSTSKSKTVIGSRRQPALSSSSMKSMMPLQMARDRALMSKTKTSVATCAVSATPQEEEEIPLFLTEEEEETERPTSPSPLRTNKSEGKRLVPTPNPAPPPPPSRKPVSQKPLVVIDISSDEDDLKGVPKRPLTKLTSGIKKQGHLTKMPTNLRDEDVIDLT